MSANKKTMKFLAMVLVFLLVVLSSGCSSAEKSDTSNTEAVTEEAVAVDTTPAGLKVALLVNGPISDAGWNASAYDGLMAVKEKFGFETSYLQVKSLSDCEQELRNYADAGYDIIFAHGFEYQDPAGKIADEYPDTHFIITSGSKAVGDNVSPIIFLEEEGYYVMGMAAAELTKTNKIGLIGGMEIPSLVYPWKGFELGVAETNPDAKVVTTWVGSWDDIGKAKESALAQIEAGYDVVFISANQAGLGGIQACAEKNVWTFGAYGEQLQLAPKQMIGELLLDIPKAFTDVTQQIVDGTFKGGIYSPGVAQGAVVFHWNDELINGNAELEAIRTKGQEMMEKISSGEKKIRSFSLEIQ
ncbi:MAG: BMP family protein [Clostridia bacterium]